MGEKDSVKSDYTKFVERALAAAIAVFIISMTLLYLRLSQIRNYQSARFNELTEDIADLRRQNDRLEKLLVLNGIKDDPRIDYSSMVVPLLTVNQSDIPNGLYVLDQKIRLKSISGHDYYSDEFTIYHIKTTIGSGHLSTTLNIGIAIGGLATMPQLYIDYNLDNKVDIDMMQQFVDLVPLGAVLKKSLNESNSQLVYNAFLENYRRAVFTSVDGISDSGHSLANEIWSFIDDQSDEILNWVAGANGAQQQPQPTSSSHQQQHK